MSTLVNSVGVMFSPKSAWPLIAQEHSGTVLTLATHTLPLAAIPAACWVRRRHHPRLDDHG
jgi:hypothetical protein